MQNILDFAELTPDNPRAPFGNPTEEPGFPPDYTDILPELSVPGTSLSLFPGYEERRAIRRYFSFICVSLMFTVLAVLSVNTLLTMLVQVILRQVDLRALGELPESYSRIASQYISGSAISPGIALLSSLTGCLAGCFVCAKLTGISTKDCFAGSPDRSRALHAPRLALYILLALLIGMAGSFLNDALLPLLRNTRFPVHALSTVSADGSASRFFLQAVTLILVIPAAEELLFRGFVLKNACRVSQRAGIFLSALLFALLQNQLLAVLPAFVLGILLAYITLHHGTVLPAMLVRAFCGLTEVTAALLKLWLSASAYRTVSRMAMLSLLGSGAICLCFFAATERMPMQTPHQSTRTFRLFFTTPAFPVLLAAVLFTAYLRML